MTTSPFTLQICSTQLIVVNRPMVLLYIRPLCGVMLCHAASQDGVLLGLRACLLMARACHNDDDDE